MEGESATEWKVEYENDVGPDDGYFVEWWTVTNGSRSFKADTEADAKWLCGVLNTLYDNLPLIS